MARAARSRAPDGNLSSRHSATWVYAWPVERLRRSSTEETAGLVPVVSAPDLLPEISTRAISTFFLYFEHSFGRRSLLAAVERIGGEPTLEYLLDPENFVSLEYVERAAEVLAEEAGDPLFLRRAGEHQLDNPRMLGFAFYLARSLGSPQLYYRVAVKTASSFNRVGEISIEELSDRRAVLRYHSLKPEKSRLICEGRIGQLAAAPRLWRMPLAEAHELECQVLGAAACRYELSWAPPVRPGLRALLAGAAGSALGLLAFGSLPSALMGAALGSLLALAVTYRTLAHDRTRQIMDSAEASGRAMYELQRRFEQVQALHADAHSAHLSLSDEMHRRERAEAALIEATKLEAIGRLSGGIAHDFNNLLTVILCSAQMAKHELAASNSVGKHLEAISEAGGRAADLTRRLLAFAREQIVEPRVLTLSDQLRGLEDMLRRLVGEDVRIEFELAPEPLNVLLDPTQLEQVLMNLAANARDALPGGGTLRFTTLATTLGLESVELLDGVQPGEYVLLTVSDTGTGMPESVRKRAFDPFFTTKPSGRGTGLGLASSYGIIRQAGGTVALESAPGSGTSVRIHLPRVRQGADPVLTAAPAVSVGGSETILIVEDDALVRRVIAEPLREAGYRVLEAASGQAALTAANSAGEIQLLISDVVMPNIDGLTLSNELRSKRPRLRTLFVSGYSNEMISNHGVLAAGIELLRKPFSTNALLARARAVLDAR